MKKKIFKNTFLLSGSQIFARGIGFFYFIFLARAMSVGEFGIYAWIMGFVYNFYPLADFGLERLVMRDIARRPEKTNSYLKKLLPLRLALALSSVVLSLILAVFMKVDGQKMLLIFIFALAILPYNLIYIIAALENAREKMDTYAWVTILYSVFTSLFGAGAVLKGFGLRGVFVGHLVGALVVLGWLLVRAGKLGLKLSWQIDLPFCKKVLSEAWVFAALLFLAVVYLRISLILVGRLLGDYEAGIYGAASKFVEAGILIPQGVALAVFPSFSRLLASDKQKLKRIYWRFLAVMLILSLPVAAVMYFGAGRIIPLIYGQAYLPAIPVFSLFGLLIIFLFINSLPGSIIQNSKKVKSFLPLAAVNLIVAFGSGLFLIPKMGVIGGVWAMIVGEIYGLAVNNWFVFKVLNGNEKE